MLRTGRRFRLLMLGTLAAIVSGQAQVLLETGVRSTHDDNVTNSGLGLSDFITETFVNAGYEPSLASGTLQFHYLGAFDYYHSLVNRSFNQHVLGGVWTDMFADDEGMVNAGLSYTRRDHRSELSFADYTLTSLYANVRWPMGDGTYGNAGYRLRFLGYADMPELNNSENSVFGQVSHVFATRTTVFLESSLGRKSYTNAASNALMQARGRSSAPSTTQAAGGIRISQSVLASMGAHAGYRLQTNLSADARYFANGYLISDDEVFDSHYGYEGDAVFAGVTQIVSGLGQISVDWQTERKDYLNRPIEDWAGTVYDEVRGDRRTTVSLGYATSLAREGVLSDIMLTAGVDFIRNVSNDVRYDYRNTVFSLQVAYGL